MEREATEPASPLEGPLVGRRRGPRRIGWGERSDTPPRERTGAADDPGRLRDRATRSMCWVSGFGDEIAPDLANQARSLSRMAIRFVEVRSVGGRNVASFDADEAKRVRDGFAEHGIGICAVASPVGKADVRAPFAAQVESLRGVLRAARILGTSRVRVFSFYVGGDHATHRAEVLRRMAHMAELAADAGCVLLLENERGVYGESPNQCLELLASVDRPSLRFTFDFANFAILGHSTLDAISRLAAYTTHFHVKDATASPPLVVPPGDGEGHIAEILRRASSAGFRGFVSLEPHLRMAGAQPTPSASAFSVAHGALLRILRELGVPHA
ncbi:MAG TPA: sugar phosphate isomerase/epimerase family protein [Gemmatimonadaceae bacterium]|nr:sugar phosphate isomerase/epimerase family protein [Gemmatimonadaceae bacterium]